MSKAGELSGQVPGKVGENPWAEALGNFFRRLLWWRSSNERLDYAEGDVSDGGHLFAVTFVRFDGKKLRCKMTLEQLNDLSDKFAAAAVGLAHPNHETFDPKKKVSDGS
jgi:hypothetical protein